LLFCGSNILTVTGSDGTVFDVDETSETKSTWIEYTASTGLLTLNANPSVLYFGSTELTLTVSPADAPDYVYP
jgi:hypothetical protein